jgi:hypothetical protein
MERGSSCIHCTVLPSHTYEIAHQFVDDLRAAVNEVKVSVTCNTMHLCTGESIE